MNVYLISCPVYIINTQNEKKKREKNVEEKKHKK